MSPSDSESTEWTEIDCRRPSHCATIQQRTSLFAIAKLSISRHTTNTTARTRNTEAVYSDCVKYVHLRHLAGQESKRVRNFV